MTTNRRDLLAGLGGAIAAAAIPRLARGAEQTPCEQPHGPYAGYFPNVVVQTHEGRRALFYNDLLRGKTVLVHCMSIGSLGTLSSCPGTRNLSQRSASFRCFSLSSPFGVLTGA